MDVVRLAAKVFSDAVLFEEKSEDVGAAVFIG